MARRVRIDKSQLAIGVPVRVRDRKHLDWIRELPCVVSRRPGPSDPAHISIGNSPGKGLKTGDNHVVPLNHLEHMRQHKVGERSFWGEDLVRVQQLALDLFSVTGDTLAGTWLVQRYWDSAGDLRQLSAASFLHKSLELGHKILEG